MLPVLLRRLTASRMPFCRRVSSLLVVLRNTRLRRAPAAACCTFWLGLRSRSTSLQMPPSWYTCILTQGSNLGLLHCRQILYHLSHQGSPASQ